jgi:hypothetical protein
MFIFLLKHVDEKLWYVIESTYKFTFDGLPRECVTVFNVRTHNTKSLQAYADARNRD